MNVRASEGRDGLQRSPGALGNRSCSCQCGWSSEWSCIWGTISVPNLTNPILLGSPPLGLCLPPQTNLLLPNDLPATSAEMLGGRHVPHAISYLQAVVIKFLLSCWLKAQCLAWSRHSNTPSVDALAQWDLRLLFFIWTTQAATVYWLLLGLFPVSERDLTCLNNRLSPSQEHKCWSEF